MLEAPLRIAAVVCSLVVLAGWSLFVIDEVRAASDTTAAEVAGRTASAQADPTPAQERDRERAHSGVREAIDDVNDVLLAPVAWLGESSSSQWWQRSAPAVVAFLLYGLGLGFLARYARGRA